MLSLFSTSSDKAGFRLQYMEVYNWGTFDGQVFKISPKGNNSLLTGANASGKSTYIDALLTLMVPIKRDRFYNQSSGVEKKGDRSEETYVLGHYGNIQREGEFSTSTQALRDKGTYSVILASYGNTDNKHITIFQLRWFNNGKLKRAFGLAHCPLEISQDFSEFDSRGNWKKRLEKQYNANSRKRVLEFFEGPTAYGERIADLFGMRSTRALNLFNHIVGVKVLENLDVFIRTNMLEGRDAEAEFIQLKESFLTLMEAKTNIEKAKEQITQLTPINDIAEQITALDERQIQLNSSKEQAVYWFAKKTVELAAEQHYLANEKLSMHREDLAALRENEEQLKEEETDLRVQIKSDAVGNQIERIKSEILRLAKSRDLRKGKLDSYNKIAEKIELPGNPGEKTFVQNRENAKLKRSELEQLRNKENEKARQAKNRRDELKQKIREAVETIKVLQKNKNNITGRVAGIREDIAAHLGVDKQVIPFIGELIKVKESEAAWEASIEKILHNFALRIIVPEQYYARVNQYVNRTNLRGKLTYQRYKGFTGLSGFSPGELEANALVRKVEFRPRSEYTDWLEDRLSRQFDYACVSDLQEFNRYKEKAVTLEGLIKFGKGKHQKDDRPHVSRRENFVLGWDNKEKIALLKQEVRSLQAEEKSTSKEIRRIEKSIRQIELRKEAYADLFKLFTKFDDIDWQSYATQIQEKEEQKLALEKTNNRVQTLQRQLEEVLKKKKGTEEKIESKGRQIFRVEAQLESLSLQQNENQKLIEQLGQLDTSMFEQANPELLAIEYKQLKTAQQNFQRNNSQELQELQKTRRRKEDEVKLKINAFKQPPEEITLRFRDWRSDVSQLPDSTHLEFISEYQELLRKLVEENLPKYEKKFNEYLQETITNKVGDFRMFFENWSDSIRENIRLLNNSLKEIDFRSKGFKTYIQIIAPRKISEEVKIFRTMLDQAIPNIRELDATVDGRKNHFINHIEPLIRMMDREDWRKQVMEVRSWYSYKAEEFYQETDKKFKTYESMGQLSGGEKAQLTYTILGSAIAYQFGLTREGLQSNSFRFIAIDEAFKAQDEDKARYLIKLCKQLHLQLLVVTPSDNIHIVENDISFVHYVERKEEKYSWLYDMPIEQFKEERAKFAVV